jgi:hypothetical protein
MGQGSDANGQYTVTVLYSRTVTAGSTQATKGGGQAGTAKVSSQPRRHRRTLRWAIRKEGGGGPFSVPAEKF